MPIVKKTKGWKKAEETQREAVKEHPWLAYMMPPMDDPTMYIHPVMGISKAAGLKAIQGLLKRAKRSPVQTEQIMTAAKLIPEKQFEKVRSIKDIDVLGKLEDSAMLERYEGIAFYDTNRIGLRGKSMTPVTSSHEVKHIAEEGLSSVDRFRAEKAFTDVMSTPKSEQALRQLGLEVNTNLGNASELLATAGSLAEVGHPAFRKFPKAIQDIVARQMERVKGKKSGWFDTYYDYMKSLDARNLKEPLS